MSVCDLGMHLQSARKEGGTAVSAALGQIELPQSGATVSHCGTRKCALKWVFKALPIASSFTLPHWCTCGQSSSLAVCEGKGRDASFQFGGNHTYRDFRYGDVL